MKKDDVFPRCHLKLLLWFKKLPDHFKGTVHRFNVEDPRNPVAATIDIMVSRIGQKRSTSNSNKAIRLMFDTKKLTFADTMIEKMKKNSQSKP